jgi:hypothetical protein
VPSGAEAIQAFASPPPRILKKKSNSKSKKVCILSLPKKKTGNIVTC